MTSNTPLEIVAGSAPGGAVVSRRLAYVDVDDWGRRRWFVDRDGFPIDDCEVQLARLPLGLERR